MGQVAFNPNGDESPSIGKLRQILKDLDNYLTILGDIGDNLPLLESVQTMTKPLKGFVKKLNSLRKDLEKDGENCKELHDAIMKIESAFEEKGILVELSIFIQDLRLWEEIGGDHSERKNVESLRLKFRDYIEDFEQELRDAVENRCYPDLEQAQ